MNERWVIGDTHFGHRALTGERADKSRHQIRPFDTVAEMDEAMIERWNAVVKQHDTVYHLGDVNIPARSLALVGRLNGRKILVKGNHDIFPIENYLEYFEDIRAYKVYKHKILLSHMPVHPGQFPRFSANIHGHLHERTVTNLFGLIDPRYYCVSVEQTNYAPVNLDEVVDKLEKIMASFKSIND